MENDYILQEPTKVHVKFDYFTPSKQSVIIKNENCTPVHTFLINTGFDLANVESHRNIVLQTITNIITELGDAEQYKKFSKIVYEFLPPYNTPYSEQENVMNVVDKIINKYTPDSSKSVEIFEEKIYHPNINDPEEYFNIIIEDIKDIDNPKFWIRLVIDNNEYNEFVIKTDEDKFKKVYIKLFWITVVNYFIGNLVVKLDN